MIDDQHETHPGLSLCIQGTQLIKYNSKDVLRFIPVYTGNTVGISQIGIFHAVYPCVYREHQLYTGRKKDARGLSLCIQGTLSLLLTASQRRRFIPVYTGNTELMETYTPAVTVYPCVYREHILTVILFI